jgi:hypothetical protein
LCSRRVSRVQQLQISASDLRILRLEKLLTNTRNRTEWQTRKLSPKSDRYNQKTQHSRRDRNRTAHARRKILGGRKMPSTHLELDLLEADRIRQGNIPGVIHQRSPMITIRRYNQVWQDTDSQHHSSRTTMDTVHHHCRRRKPQIPQGSGMRLTTSKCQQTYRH